MPPFLPLAPNWTLQDWSSAISSESSSAFTCAVPTSLLRKPKPGSLPYLAKSIAFPAEHPHPNASLSSPVQHIRTQTLLDFTPSHHLSTTYQFFVPQAQNLTTMAWTISLSFLCLFLPFFLFWLYRSITSITTNQNYGILPIAYAERLLQTISRPQWFCVHLSNLSIDC